MRCLQCGRELALFKRLTKGEFCSEEHRLQYQKDYSQLALSRLLQAKPPAETEARPGEEPPPAKESRERPLHVLPAASRLKLGPDPHGQPLVALPEAAKESAQDPPQAKNKDSGRPAALPAATQRIPSATARPPQPLGQPAPRSPGAALPPTAARAGNPALPPSRQSSQAGSRTPAQLPAGATARTDGPAASADPSQERPGSMARPVSSRTPSALPGGPDKQLSAPPAASPPAATSRARPLPAGTPPQLLAGEPPQPAALVPSQTQKKVAAPVPLAANPSLPASPSPSIAQPATLQEAAASILRDIPDPVTSRVPGQRAPQSRPPEPTKEVQPPAPLAGPQMEKPRLAPQELAVSNPLVQEIEFPAAAQPLRLRFGPRLQGLGRAQHVPLVDNEARVKSEPVKADASNGQPESVAFFAPPQLLTLNLRAEHGGRPLEIDRAVEVPVNACLGSRREIYWQAPPAAYHGSRIETGALTRLWLTIAELDEPNSQGPCPADGGEAWIVERQELSDDQLARKPRTGPKPSIIFQKSAPAQARTDSAVAIADAPSVESDLAVSGESQAHDALAQPPHLVTEPVALTLSAITGGTPEPVCDFSLATTSEVEAPHILALPMHPLLLLADQDESATEAPLVVPTEANPAAQTAENSPVPLESRRIVRSQLRLFSPPKLVSSDAPLLMVAAVSLPADAPSSVEDVPSAKSAETPQNGTVLDSRKNGRGAAPAPAIEYIPAIPADERPPLSTPPPPATKKLASALSAFGAAAFSRLKGKRHTAGEWQQMEGVNGHCILLSPALQGDDYTFEMTASFSEAPGETAAKTLISFAYRVQDGRNYQVAQVGLRTEEGQRLVVLSRYTVMDGVTEPARHTSLPALALNPALQSHSVRFEARGDYFIVWIGIRRVAEWSDSRLMRGGAGIFLDGNATPFDAECFRVDQHSGTAESH